MNADPVNPSLVRRVRHELRRREVTVRRVESPSPGFRRIIFGGEALADFVSDSFDDHVKLILPAQAGSAPLLRDYTPVHFNPAARELTLEFALHAAGQASAWAAQALPGQAAEIGGPRGSFIIPTDLHWHWLVGDETALPAVSRRLAELPSGSRVSVVLQTADPADRRVLPSAAALDLHWVDDAEALLRTVRALPRPMGAAAAAGRGYAWAAGEAQTMSRLRRVLVEEKALTANELRVSAYWKRGVAAYHETLER